jgi:hypothetical protein
MCNSTMAFSLGTTVPLIVMVIPEGGGPAGVPVAPPDPLLPLPGPAASVVPPVAPPVEPRLPPAPPWAPSGDDDPDPPLAGDPPVPDPPPGFPPAPWLPPVPVGVDDSGLPPAPGTTTAGRGSSLTPQPTVMNPAITSRRVMEGGDRGAGWGGIRCGSELLTVQ